MTKTGIEYLTHSWSPIAMRCSPCSEGCTHCWSLPLANRMAHNPIFSDEIRAAYAGETGPVLVESRLDDPIKRKKPAIIGTQFMGDLFHKDVPDEFIDRIFVVMALAKQHRFIVLTKRAERMCKYMNSKEFECDISDSDFLPAITNSPREGMKRIFWPPSNVIGMVTVENNQTLKRIDWLMKARFVMRGISFEPLLEGKGIDIINVLAGTPVLKGKSYSLVRPDWIIAGGESSLGARPMHPDWARSLRDQCKVARVPFFMKQMSGRTKEERHAIPDDLMVRGFPEGIKL